MKKSLIIILLLNLILEAKTKSDYYEMLRNNCKDKCCYYSYEIMERNEYVLDIDTENCLNINKLNCNTTYKWCIDITYDENIYKKKMKF